MIDLVKLMLDNWQSLLKPIRTFYLQVEIKPQAKQSVRFNRRTGRAFPDVVKQKYVADVVEQLKAQYVGAPICGHVRLTCVYSFPWTKDTKSMVSLGWVLKADDPDLDNLQKPLADALNGVCLGDDAQIVCVQSIKVRSNLIGIAIKIEEVMIDRKALSEICV
jgi:Holliday junction resolvase RusA-like endonuclease